MDFLPISVASRVQERGFLRFGDEIQGEKALLKQYDSTEGAVPRCKVPPPDRTRGTQHPSLGRPSFPITMFRHEDKVPTVSLDDRADRKKDETAVVRGIWGRSGDLHERVRPSGDSCMPCCQGAIRRSGRLETARFRRTDCDGPGVREGDGRVCFRDRGAACFRGHGGKFVADGALGPGSDGIPVLDGNPFCPDGQALRECGLQYGPVRVPPAVQVSGAP